MRCCTFMSWLLKTKKRTRKKKKMKKIYEFTCTEYDENNIMFSRTHAMLRKDSHIMAFSGIL